MELYIKNYEINIQRKPSKKSSFTDSTSRQKNASTQESPRKKPTREIIQKPISRTVSNQRTINSVYFVNEMTDYDPTGKAVLIDIQNSPQHLLPLQTTNLKIPISGSKSHSND